MPITKARKAEIYESYLNALSNTIGVVVAEYRGMGMKGLSSIRNQLRPLGAKLQVVKCPIFRIALKEKGFASPRDLITGPIVVALVQSDIAKVTKTILGSLKENPLLIPKGAILGQTVFKEAQLEAVSTMPTIDEARASFLGTLNAPASQLVRLLATPAQDLAGVLKAYTDKEQGGEAA